MLLSCSNSDDSFTPQNITPILIGKGSLMGSEGLLKLQMLTSTIFN